MFDKREEGRYKSDKAKILSILDDEINAEREEHRPSCTYPEDVKGTIRATFQFIKDNPVIIEERVAGVYIAMAAFLTKDENEEENNFNYAVTELNGVVKEVYDSYAVLEGKNEKGTIFDIKVMYKKILYLGHLTIRQNFQNYVNYINESASLCKDCNSEGYNLLIRIAKILGRNDPKERDFVFLLGGVLTRDIKAENISIIRNLVVVEDIYVNPITSIGGFSQIPNKK